MPEGLLLAVTVTLAFVTTRILQDNNLVRLLRVCETIGNATTIYSNKTGTLTENKISIIAATLSTIPRFSDLVPLNYTASRLGPVIISPLGFASTLSPLIKSYLL